MFIKNVLSNLNSKLVRLVKEIGLYSDVAWVRFNSEHLCLLSWCYSLFKPMWRWPQLVSQYFGPIGVRRVKLWFQCFEVSPCVGLLDFAREKQTSTWEQWNQVFFFLTWTLDSAGGIGGMLWAADTHGCLPWHWSPFLPAFSQSENTVTVVLPCTKSTLKSVATSPVWYGL